MKTLNFALAATAALTFTAFADTGVPEVSGVSFVQSTPGSRDVTIQYTLGNAPGIITVDVLTNDVSIGDGNITYLTGDVNKLITTMGAHTITWRADKSWPGHKITDSIVKVKVNAWAANNPPNYMVVDLLQGTNIHYYTSEEALPDGGLTNAAYRISRLVMRRIPAANIEWTMGARGELTSDAASEAPHNVTLSNDYYIGIFEVTQGQWANIKIDSWPSFWNNVGDAAGRPVEQVSYNDIRGSAVSSYYPANPDSGSFLGLLRTKTGLAFDLPGEAQWKYACRAGNYEGKWGDGSPILVKSSSSDTNLGLLARYAYNGGKIGGTNSPAQGCGATNGTAIVGSYRPNSWGLYDMHGNVWEWCLDLYAADISSLNGAVNTNTALGSFREVRGGSWNFVARDCRPACRGMGNPSGRSGNFGFRPALAVGL